LYGKFRKRIKDLTNEISPIKGEYEADESYFGLCLDIGYEEHL